MTKRLRTLSERQLRAIGENGLHTDLGGALASEVSAALDAFAAGIPGETVHLDEITLGLAGMLRQQEGIKKLVQEVGLLGGTGLAEDELYEAIAAWIVDTQLGGGLDWDPQRRLNET